MLKKFSEFISVILHPVFYFFYIYNYFFFSEPDFFFVHPKLGFLLNLLIFFNTVIVPVGLIFLLKKKITLTERSDRPGIFILVAIIYGAAWYSLKNVEFPVILHNLLLSFAGGLFLLGLLSFKNKVSLHTTGAGIVVFFFFYQYLFYPGLL